MRIVNAGTRFGPYVVVRRLGGLDEGIGGQGTVVVVRKDGDDAELALKYCNATDDESLRRFAREVRMMSGIIHPNVVPIIDASPEGRPPYYVMPLARHSLLEEIASVKGDIERVVQIFLDICAGVRAIHSAGGVHRDLKPPNVLRMSDGRLVVSDLGSAKLSNRDTTVLTTTMAPLGTDCYRAPEQMVPGGNRDADERTDVFQLGKILFELYSGEIPAVLNLELLEDGLRGIVRKATRDDPQRRYQSVGELLDALSMWLESKKPDANPIALAEERLARVADRLAQGSEYKKQELAALFAAFSDTLADDPDAFLLLFDKIPLDILVMAGASDADGFESLLAKYCRVLGSGALRRKGYSYAERVADRIEAALSSAKSASLWSMGMRALLIAAVGLHRFAAMDTLAKLLQAVPSEDAAMEVAEMLEEEIQRYAVVAEQVSSLRLRPSLRPVREKAVELRKRQEAGKEI